MEKQNFHGKLGRRGLLIVLKKTSKKRGKTSTVRVGTIKTLTLNEPVVTGFSIIEIRNSDNLTSRKKTRKFPITSSVIGFREISANVFEVETLTSFYELRIMS